MKKKTRLKRWQESELRNWVHPSGVIDPAGIRESMKQEIARVLEEIEETISYKILKRYAMPENELINRVAQLKKEYGIEG